MFLLKSDSLLGGHKYPKMGQAAKLAEALGDRIFQYLKKLKMEVEIAKIYS